MVAPGPILDESFHGQERIHKHHEASHVKLEEATKEGNGSEVKDIHNFGVRGVFGDEGSVYEFPVIVGVEDFGVVSFTPMIESGAVFQCVSKIVLGLQR